LTQVENTRSTLTEVELRWSGRSGEPMSERFIPLLDAPRAQVWRCPQIGQTQSSSGHRSDRLQRPFAPDPANFRQPTVCNFRCTYCMPKEAFGPRPSLSCLIRNCSASREISRLGGRVRCAGASRRSGSPGGDTAAAQGRDTPGREALAGACARPDGPRHRPGADEPMLRCCGAHAAGPGAVRIEARHRVARCAGRRDVFRRMKRRGTFPVAAVLDGHRRGRCGPVFAGENQHGRAARHQRTPDLADGTLLQGAAGTRCG